MSKLAILNCQLFSPSQSTKVPRGDKHQDGGQQEALRAIPTLLPTGTLLPGDLPGWTLQRQVHINLVVLGCSAQGDLAKSDR